jgi:exodeoxyribonuclease VII small subunit
MAKTTSRNDPSAQTPSFEAALARLEQIVEKLDDGDLPLAQSIALFKEGTTLAKRCRALLAEAEVHVKEVLGDSQSADADVATPDGEFRAGEASSEGTQAGNSDE